MASPSSKDEFMRKLASRVSELEQTTNFQGSHIEQLQTQISRCLTIEKNTATVLAKLEHEHSVLSNYTRSLEEYCLELDVGLRKKHLILTGILESDEELNRRPRPDLDPDNPVNDEADEQIVSNHTHEIAFESLSAIHDTLTHEDIDLAYRIGRKKGDAPRPILIKFTKEATRNEVNRKRRNLKDSDETKGSYLNEDLPQKVNQRRADLRCIVNNAKAKNLEAKAMGDRINIGNVIYSYQDIDSLPQGLTLEDAKTVNTPRGIAFQGPDSFLSNFYVTSVKFNGRIYPSAEHAYQHDRATYLGRHAIARQVLTAPSPPDAKKAGNRAGRSHQWDLCKQDRLKEIVIAKFTQHPDLRDKLVSTGSTTLIEATYDSFWGAGASITARSLIDGTWRGRNVFGSILDQVRTEMRRLIAVQGQNTTVSTTQLPGQQQSQTTRATRPHNAPPPPPSQKTTTTPIKTVGNRDNKNKRKSVSAPTTVLPASQQPSLPANYSMQPGWIPSYPQFPFSYGYSMPPPGQMPVYPAHPPPGQMPMYPAQPPPVVFSQSGPQYTTPVQSPDFFNQSQRLEFNSNLTSSPV